MCGGSESSVISAASLPCPHFVWGRFSWFGQQQNNNNKASWPSTLWQQFGVWGFLFQHTKQGEVHSGVWNNLIELHSTMSSTPSSTFGMNENADCTPWHSHIWIRCLHALALCVVFKHQLTLVTPHWVSQKRQCSACYPIIKYSTLLTYKIQRQSSVAYTPYRWDYKQCSLRHYLVS